MTNPSVRKQKSGDQLAVGDWLAPEELMEGAAEVLFAYAYPARADRSRDNDGKHVQLVVRGVGETQPYTDIVAGGTLFDLASDEDLAEYREAAERARKIADLRAVADFLDRNSWAPIPHSLGVAYVDGTPRFDHDADGLAELRRIADALGEKPDERLDDRTVVERQFGRFTYEVIAWHKDGRPAEPAPEPAGDPTVCSCAADPLECAAHGPSARASLAASERLRGLVDETEPVPVAKHEVSTAWKGDNPGECGMECTCGTTYDGFDSLAEVEVHMARHIEAATSPTGLTKAADATRGPLAGTTPVVTYFSFGHGQHDPDSGKRLIDHYVTVVAPTYGACREAMFASRFGDRWSFDYLAGRSTTTEAVSEWTEHEVIVAPGTGGMAAELALEAARAVLAASSPVSEAR